MLAFIDLTNHVYGRLTVLSRAGTQKYHTRWKCLCSCGKTTVVYGGDLRNGHTSSCGCFRKETAAQTGKARTTHGHSPQKGATRTYRSWHAMRSRCMNENATGYERYGARGIAVCPQWCDSFETFLSDMGERPANTSIDRINNDLGYFKENCRWATWKEQNSNRKPTAQWNYKAAHANQLAVAA